MNKDEIITRIENAESELKAAREALENYSEVKPVYPDKGFALYVGGDTTTIHRDYFGEKAALQGCTFHSEGEAEKESLRRAAETRVREKINIANEGGNGFKNLEDNYLVYYYHNEEILKHFNYPTDQETCAWIYIRSLSAVEDLLKDNDFCADYKLMLGI